MTTIAAQNTRNSLGSPKPLIPPVIRTLLIPCTDGELYRVHPLHTSAFLFVHKSLSPSDSGRPWYRVSHILTGISIVRGAEQIEDAVLVMRALSGLDWDFDHPSRCPNRTRSGVSEITGLSFCMDAISIKRWERIWKNTSQR